MREEAERGKGSLTVLLSAHWTWWTLWGCRDETGISLCHSQCVLTPAETLLPVTKHKYTALFKVFWMQFGDPCSVNESVTSEKGMKHRGGIKLPSNVSYSSV